MIKPAFPNDLKCRYFISTADVDFQANLTPGALVNFLIQTAWKHADILGWGVDDLLKHNLTWVLSGLKIKFFSYPKWKEEIDILTWPKGINRLFYLRDFTILNAQQQVIGQVTSSWLLIDINKRRPKIHDLENEVFSYNLERHAIDELIPNLKTADRADNSIEYTVRYSDIDVNHHLTTTRYIDLVMDSFQPEFFKSQMPKELTVNFLKEVLYNQKLFIQQIQNSEKEYNLQLITTDCIKPHFICKLSF